MGVFTWGGGCLAWKGRYNNSTVGSSDFELHNMVLNVSKNFVGNVFERFWPFLHGKKKSTNYTNFVYAFLIFSTLQEQIMFTFFNLTQIFLKFGIMLKYYYVERFLEGGLSKKTSTKYASLGYTFFSGSWYTFGAFLPI